MSSAPTQSITEEAPSESQLTDYDRAHLPIYLRLLDAAAEGTAWEEAARIVLGIDPVREPERAKHAHDSHLARARWLSEHGYRDLLRRG
ncbi:MAG: DNA -binding domain-containing protein [Methylovirgula sp.]